MHQPVKQPLEPARYADLADHIRVEAHYVMDDGAFPNNGALQLIVMQGVIAQQARNEAALFEAFFTSNGWGATWRNGIYPFHHYHSTAHEVLGIAAGTALVQFGGPEGVQTQLSRGDVVIIPAGVAHKNLGASSDLLVVGAYPNAQLPDMRYGKPDERPFADELIAMVTLPAQDPVYGAGGPLVALWHNADGPVQ